VNWMCVAEDTEKCRAIVNTAMNLLISYKAERGDIQSPLSA